MFPVKGSIQASQLNNSEVYVTFIFLNLNSLVRTKFQVKLDKGQTNFEVSLDLSQLEEGSYHLAGFTGFQYYFETQVYRVVSTDQLKKFNISGPVTENL